MAAPVYVQNLPSELVPAPGVSMSIVPVTDGAVVALPALAASTAKAWIVLDGCDCRYRLDGTNPTTSAGVPFYEAGPLLCSRESYAQLRFIAMAGQSGIIYVQQFVYTGTAALRAAGLSVALETVSFDRVRDFLLSRLGQLDAATLNWSSAKKDNLAHAVEDWLRRGWEEEKWPRLSPVEPRDVDVSGGFCLVPWSGSGLVNIAHVQGVFASDPRINANATPIPYKLVPEGLALSASIETESVFIRYRLQCPRLVWSVEYSGSTTYAAGTVVYWPTTGRCYMALESTIAHAPADTAYWEEQKIPAFLYLYAQYGALADLMQDDGQDEKRVDRQMARAQDELLRAKCIEIEQQGVHETAFRHSR